MLPPIHSQVNARGINWWAVWVSFDCAPFDGSTLAHGSTFAHHPERESRDRPERKSRDRLGATLSTSNGSPLLLVGRLREGSQVPTGRGLWAEQRDVTGPKAGRQHLVA